MGCIIKHESSAAIKCTLHIRRPQFTGGLNSSIQFTREAREKCDLAAAHSSIDYMSSLTGLYLRVAKLVQLYPDLMRLTNLRKALELAQLCSNLMHLTNLRKALKLAQLCSNLMHFPT